jgi:hypothetical protein
MFHEFESPAMCFLNAAYTEAELTASMDGSIVVPRL